MPMDFLNHNFIIFNVFSFSFNFNVDKRGFKLI